MPILSLEPNLFPNHLFDAPPELPGFGRPPAGCDRRWWGVNTKSRQEKTLARTLFREEIPFYLPLVARQSMSRNLSRRNSYVPVFPGYLFICCDDTERVTALTTNCITQMLPVSDPDELTRDLTQISRAIESDVPLTVERRVASGDRVKIKAGPMTGMEGIVLERRKTIRLLIALNYLQGGVSLEIDDCYVEPV